MKKTTNLVVLAILTVALVGAQQVAKAYTITGYPQVTPSPVLMYETALRGPDIANPAYPAWASNVVQSVYDTGKPPVATNSWPLTNGLSADMVMQPTQTTNNWTLWYLIHVRAISSSFMFSPSNLVFVGSSSDNPYNSLGKVNYFTNSSFIYSPWGRGIVWDSVGPRHSDTIYEDASAGAWNDHKVNEFIFIGSQSKYYWYSNASDSNNVVTYVNGFSGPSGFETTGTWFLNCPSNVVAQSQVTLQTRGVPLTPVQTIQSFVPGSVVTLGVNMDTNRTIVVQYKPSLQWGNWSDVCTMNSGDTITWPMSSSLNTYPLGFFRYYLER